MTPTNVSSTSIGRTEPPTVLVSLDMSPLSEAALPVAVELAELMGAQVHLLLVIDGHLGHEVEERAKRDGDTMDDAAERYLGDVTNRHEGVVSIGWSHRHALEAADAIVDEAARQEASLVVLASHGRSGFSRFLAGSVAEEVMRTSTVPVVVVPSRAVEPRGEAPADQST